MDKNYCVLIDSENSSKRMKEIFEEISKYGSTPIRRLYGDFFDKSNTWKSVCEEFALTPIQSFNFTKGKNSIDISLVADGMELLYKEEYLDGIVIVASDSDYTPLARKWRAEGKEVIGIGKKNTPDSLKKSCTAFIHIENLLTDEESIKEKTERVAKIDSHLKETVKELLVSHDGVLLISVIVNAILKSNPTFDVRSFGYKKAPEFFKKEFSDILEIHESKKNIYVAKLKSEAISRNEIAEKIITLVKKSKGKKINLGELNKKVKQMRIDITLLGYSRLRKYLETIPELTIEDNNVYLKGD